jgi:hypothetical protein
VSQSRIFVVPIESNDDIYDGLPIYEKIQLLFMDYLYEIQINELDKYDLKHINTLDKCIK